MVTQQEVRDAILVIAKYEQQLMDNKYNKIISKQPSSIGCTVKLSMYGIEMQGKSRSKLRGVVIDYLSWYGVKDGLSTVKWTGISKPDTMHVSHLEYVKHDGVNSNHLPTGDIATETK